MNINSLPKESGMLFIWEEEMPRGFWMKNTLIPLDIIWINDQEMNIEALYSKLTGLVKQINIKDINNDVNNDVINTIYVKLLNLCPDEYIKVNKGKNELIYNCSTCEEEEEFIPESPQSAPPSPSPPQTSLKKHLPDNLKPRRIIKPPTNTRNVEHEFASIYQRKNPRRDYGNQFLNRLFNQ